MSIKRLFGKVTKARTALVLVFLFLLSVFSFSPAANATDYTEYIVRAGLQYGSSAVGYANFQVATGTGTSFSFGYYDNDRKFVPLYALSSEPAITVIRSNHYNPTTNAYASDGADSSSVIGAYHLEADVSFASAEELANAVPQVYGITNYFTFPAYTSGGYRVRIGRYTSTSAAEGDLATVQTRLQNLYPGATLKVVGKGENAYTVFRTGSRNILFEWDGATRQLGIQAIGGDHPETWTRWYKYLGGFDFLKNNGSWNFSVVNVVKLVDYVKGVVPYEMGSSFPAEAQKAQAVAASTFGVKNRHRHASSGFDVCTGQHCQVYLGTTSAAASTIAYIEEVAGIIITYNGEPINAVYSASSGGHTENSENVWVQALPYLRGVPDPYEVLTVGNNGIWTRTMTGEALGSRLRSQGYTIGTVTNVYVAEYTEAGNVLRLALTDGTRTVTLSKENMRIVIGTGTLLSQRFRVSSGGALYVNDGEVLEGGLSGAYAIDGSGNTVQLVGANFKAITATGIETVEAVGNASEFTFEGRGWGHGLGMSQQGARGMANQGWTYDQILKHYYTGVELVSTGP
jgi:stage II sporulation protein D